MYINSHYSMFSVEVLKAMGHPVCLGCKIALFCCIIFFLLRTVVYCFQIQYAKKALFNVFINMLVLCYLIGLGIGTIFLIDYHNIIND